ncbi:hypothetical protein I4U23_012850 [Adineta vaga]|nr:hypothetical protein I4U23_012850 [Adineta vaga]
MISEEFLNRFRQIMAILCCVFGLPGNLLTIIVCIKALYLRTIHFQRKVFHLYLVEISILDTCLLLYWIIETLLNYLHKIQRIEFLSLMHMSAFSCYFSYMMNRLCAALCSWLLTCFTFIRFINIFHKFNTIRSNIILLISLIVIFSIANSYSFIVLEYNPKQISHRNSTHKNGTVVDYRSVCTIRSKYAEDRLTLLMNILVAGVLSLAIPALLISIVNITILCVIKRIYSTQIDDKTKRRSDITNYRSTRSTLLVISITYALFYLPYIIFYFLMIILEDRDGTLYYWSEITYILRHVSHSVNFYAYMFTSLSFRHECILLVRSLFQPCLYFKKRRQYKRKKKRSQLILIDKSPLPPPVPFYSSLNGKSLRITTNQRLEQFNFNQQEEHRNTSGKTETWM